MLELYEGKLSRTVLRGEEGRKPLDLPGSLSVEPRAGKGRSARRNMPIQSFGLGVPEVHELNPGEEGKFLGVYGDEVDDLRTPLG